MTWTEHTHRRPSWLRGIEAEVLACARDGEFTSDDVWRRVSARPELATDEPRALGNVLRRMARAGTIVATGEWRRSSRAACHGRPVQVWRAVGVRERRAA